MNVERIRTALTESAACGELIGDSATVGDRATTLKLAGAMMIAALEVARSAIEGTDSEAYSTNTWVADVRLAMGAPSGCGHADFTLVDAVDELEQGDMQK